MKFKNAVFLNERFMQTITKCNEFTGWDPKPAYWFNRFVKKMGSSQEDYNDIRVKLIKKFAEDPEAEEVKVGQVHVQAFTTELGELLDEEFEIEGINKIKFPEGLQLSPQEMGLVDEIFDMSSFEDDDE
jgi:hypothetical protein